MTVVTVDRAGRPLYVNRAARQIYARRDGLLLLRDGISAQRPHEAIALRTSIREAASARTRGVRAPGGTMTIVRPSLLRPYSVLVTPLRLRLEAEREPDAAAVFITDPEHIPDTRGELLQRLFGLTQGQARVLKQLLDGHRLTATAARLGMLANNSSSVTNPPTALFRKGFCSQCLRANISNCASDNSIRRFKNKLLSIQAETARWHLKEIYRRTGNSRRVKCSFTAPLVLLTAADSERRGSASRLVLYADNQTYTDPDLLPIHSDEGFSGWRQRVRSRSGDAPVSLVGSALQRHSFELWLSVAQSLKGLLTRTGLPPFGLSIGAFIGDYDVTPFGVHKDASEVLMSMIRGTKRIRVWRTRDRRERE